MKNVKTRILAIISVVLCVCLLGAFLYLNAIKDDAPIKDPSEVSETAVNHGQDQKEEPIDQQPGTTVRPVDGEYTPAYTDKEDDLKPMAIDDENGQSSSDNVKEDSSPSAQKQDEDNKASEQSPSSQNSPQDNKEETPSENGQDGSQSDSSQEQTPAGQNEDPSQTNDPSQHDNKGTDLPPVPLH